ncbi:MAG: hypothetical protein H7A32_01445 [Deltaproteobacteria bacterium]|nr:hypothetical protein [Deltaproteobacteria bacterium]
MVTCSKINKLLKTLFACAILFISSCGSTIEDPVLSPGETVIEPGVFGPNVSGTPDEFRGAGIINQEEFLIGGPLARGIQGDILIQNDKVRFVIKQPGRMAGIGSYGGHVVDADLFRPKSEPGQDNFGFIYPLLNIAWTTNCPRIEIVNDKFENGAVTVRTVCSLDVYDYIMTKVITMFARISEGEDIILNYDERFDDALDPFNFYEDLRAVNPVVVTDYTLKEGSSYLIMETKIENRSEDKVPFPVGDWVNGSGPFEMFVPQQGFVNSALVDKPYALVYQKLEDDAKVSYGYFSNPFLCPNLAEEGEDPEYPGAAGMSVSGVTIMVLCEEGLLDVFPLSGKDANLNYKLQPGINTVTRYLAVGNGDAASVTDAGYKALGIGTFHASGTVTDQGGQKIANAKVLFFTKNTENPQLQFPVTIAMTDSNGNFSADLPTSTDTQGKLLGSKDGQYVVEVYKEGYLRQGTSLAGKCEEEGFVDYENFTWTGIECKLGVYGTVTPSVEAGGQPGPARITILGFDPSPIANVGTAGRYGDILYKERPYGVLDVLYIDPNGELYPKGNPRVMANNQFRLEPGNYTIVYTRGTEYSVDYETIFVQAGGQVDTHGVLDRVLETPGFVSADLHVHGIDSPDSPFPRQNRIRAIMAEGLDAAGITDHEYVSDYGPDIEKLGYSNYLKTFPGDEITPFSYGHTIVWPLTPKPGERGNGAYDYTYVPEDDILGPQHSYTQTMDQIFAGVDSTNPGEQVLSVAHITDKVLGNFAISRYVTTDYWKDEVEPLSSYSDPILFRLKPNTNSAGKYAPPFPLGTSEMIPTQFTSVGLTIGTFKDTLDHLLDTALPTYFNMLNLGIKSSATSNSDGHYEIIETVGEPRNYVASSIDPADGMGSYPELDPFEMAASVNKGQVIVTNGVFVKPTLKSNNNPDGVSVGGTISGTGNVTLDLEVMSNEFFDWNHVLIFANTVPIPAKDDMSGPTDLDPESFHYITKDHHTKYLMEPIARLDKDGEGNEKLEQIIENGVRKASISRSFNFTEDTWIVVVVHGDNQVYSTFPMGTKIANKDVAPENFLVQFAINRTNIGGSPTYAFTNPMFVDVDGDGFKALHVADGTSPWTNQ